MAQVDYELVVETADGHVRHASNCTAKYNQVVHGALADSSNTLPAFRFESGSKFGLLPFLTKVWFAGHTKEKKKDSFWQILVNNKGDVTPIGLYDYVIQDNDQIILRYTTISY